MDQKQKTFLQIDTELLSAKTICYKGNNVELSFLEKGVYSHMKYRYDFFSSKNQEYFESQQCIADVFATSLKTIQRTIKKLQDVGLISITATAKNNKYVVYDYNQISLSYDTVKHSSMIRTTSFTKDTYIKNSKNNKQMQPSPILVNNNINDFYDLTDLPF